MQLKDQVISLEQAKKLKKLWFEREYFVVWWIVNWNSFVTLKSAMTTTEEQYPAYTVSELMEILPFKIMPSWINDIRWTYILNIGKWQNIKGVVYEVLYYDLHNKGNLEYTENQNLAQALWDILIRAIENKYIEL